MTLEAGIAGKLRQQDFGAVGHIAYARKQRGRGRGRKKEGWREGGMLLLSPPPNLSIGNAPPTVGRSPHFTDPNQDGPLQDAQRPVIQVIPCLIRLTVETDHDRFELESHPEGQRLCIGKAGAHTFSMLLNCWKIIIKE